MKLKACSISLFTLPALMLFAAPMPAQESNTPAKLPPDIVVTARKIEISRPGWLQEEQPVGAYGQPEWTTARRFPGTRVYLQQTPWNTGVEQWVRFRHFRDGSNEARFQEEFEVGLPNRFQLDLYETWGMGQERGTYQDEYSAEIRYALADWGKIPLNPTLYLEYAQHDHDPNTIEGKLLLGTDIAPGWHWGLNLAVEQELNGPDDTLQLTASQGISYSLIDGKLGAGIEMEYSHETAYETPVADSFLIGPSVQWRITPWMHLDFAPMFGATNDSPEVQTLLVFGIDFGSGNDKERYEPTSRRGH
ncbi:MAG: hypothetical protein PHD76_13125 [Methylacidiphilales bacterium]|nr:hypothetical protein [Candidatus Methylacidiphilales bacterium]